MKISTGFPIARHSIVKISSKDRRKVSKTRKDGFLLFGGVTKESAVSGALCLLETHCSPWRQSELSTTGIGPSARYDHVCHFLASSNMLVIHGGRNTTDIFSDTHLLDLDTMIWCTVSYTNPQMAIPRASALSFVFSNPVLTKMINCTSARAYLKPL